MAAISSREALELPADAGAQRVERHALDMGEMAHGEVAIGRLAGRDGESAIAQHGRGDAERRRGIDERVPGDLGIVVGVAVDDAGRQGQAASRHRLLGRAELATDLGDLPAGHPEVAAHGRAAGPVVDFGILDDQVKHFGSLDFRHGVTRRQPFPVRSALNEAMSDANDEALLSRLVGALAPARQRVPPAAFGRIEHAPPRC
jgi:hypothetical protein